MTVRTPRRSRLAALTSLVAAGALLLGGCGDQTDDEEEGGDGGGTGGTSQETGEAEAELHGLLPQRIRDADEIVVGSDIAYPPIEFIDENDEIVGIDPDIAAALGEVLGVEFTFQNGTFDGLILGMNNDRYDIIMSAMTDTKERQEGASADAEGGGADFVNYFRAGSAILVPAGNPEGVQGLQDLCGLSVAAQQATANETIVNERKAACDGELDPIINDVDDASITALQNGRADAVITDYPVALYQARTAGDGELFEVVGDQIDAAPYGIAVPKDEPALRQALLAALQEIMENGTYDEILQKWEAESGAIEEATVNAGT